MAAATYQDLNKESKALICEFTKLDPYQIKWQSNTSDAIDFSEALQFPKFNWAKFPYYVISENDQLFIYNSRTHFKTPIHGARGKPQCFFRHETTKVVTLLYIHEKLFVIDFDTAIIS